MTLFSRLVNWTSTELMKLSLIIVILAATWSLYRLEFFRVHDFTHAARISEMARALNEGHFPVRWSQNLGFGFGMPLFNFYAPLPYYVGAVLFNLGLDVVLVIKLLYLICTILTTWGAFQLGKEWFGRWGGVLAAAALTLAPYRAVNLFVRGSLSEAWAIAFLPIIIWAMTRIVKQQKSGWSWLIFGLVGLFLSHNITTMLFAPILLIVGLGLLIIQFWPVHSKFEWQNFIKVVSNLLTADLMSLGLAAFYLMPAFLEKDLTKFQTTIISGYFDYRLHFLYIRQFFNPTWMYGGSGWGPNDGISFYLGTGQLLAIFILLLLLGTKALEIVRTHKFTWSRNYNFILIGFLVAGLGLFMSLEKSVKIWQAINVLAYSQFPWRWLSPAIVGIAILAAAVPAVLAKKWWRSLLLVLVWLVVVVGNMASFRPEAYLAESQGYYYTDPAKIQSAMSDILPDYIPLQMAEKLVPPQKLWLNPDLGEDNIEVLVNRTHEKLFRIKSLAPVNLDVALADFPSWQLEIDGQKSVKAQGALGNIQVAIPAGEHLIGIVWAGSQLENLSNSISLVSLIILISLKVYQIQTLANDKKNNYD